MSVSIYKTALIAAMVAPLAGQSTISFVVGGGPTVPAKHVSRRFDTGFNNLELTNGALQGIGVPGGSGRIYSVTLNPMLAPDTGEQPVRRLPDRRRRLLPADDRVHGAIVRDRNRVRSVLWNLFPVEVPTTTVLGSFSQNRGGVNGGAGISVRLGAESKASFFTESRYHYIYTSPVRTSLLPGCAVVVAHSV